jgi:hypothetical protein
MAPVAAAPATHTRRTHAVAAIPAESDAEADAEADADADADDESESESDQEEDDQEPSQDTIPEPTQLREDTSVFPQQNVSLHGEAIPTSGQQHTQPTQYLSSSSIDALLDSFLTNELNQIMNEDLSPVLEEFLQQNNMPTGSLEFYREIIPIDIEYRIQFDPSGGATTTTSRSTS